MIRAVFFDIDGTLISMKTRVMPESCLKALYAMKEKGIRLFVASGRPPVHLQLLAEEFNAFPWDGLILLNGQYCVDAEGEVFHRQTVSQETLKELVPWLKAEADFPCIFYELDHSYDIRFNEGMHAYLSSIGRLDQMPPVEDPERSFTHDTYQICPYMEAQRDPEFLAHAPQMESARWSPDFADMIPAGGGKTEGIRRMMARYGLENEEWMAFGDGGNDIGMIKAATIGVAMGNGADDVKAAADYVTADCEKDGVALACEHFKLF